MGEERVDAVVLGLGPGGEQVAGDLAEAGLNVIGIERELVGGECPYWGCIPSKMMVRNAGIGAETRRVNGFAGTATVELDWSKVAHRIRAEATDSWDDTVAVERFTGKGGHFVRGSGRVVGPRSVEVDGITYVAGRALVIGTGSEPAIPPVPGLDGGGFWTNREAVQCEELPQSLVVLGGGAIGLELAQVFARFGVEVTVVEGAPRLLPLEEPEAAEDVRAAFEAEGITVHTGAGAERVDRRPGGFAVVLKGGVSVEAERLLVATGRRARVRDLGLDLTGIDTSSRFVRVDERCRAADRVWAVGDVTGNGMFTHVSIYMARIAAADILGREVMPADFRALPRVTFTDPEVGAAGLTEAQARERGIRVRVGVGNVGTSTRGWIHGPGGGGHTKLVEDADRGVLVGGTATGPMGGEVLSMLTVAIREEVPVEHLRNGLWAYPTFHRGIEDALAALERAAD